MTINFNNKVAIVTGAGNGLGRSHALELARRGAKVVINDLGGQRDGSGSSLSAAEEVVALIKSSGGEAFAHGANVADFSQVQDMVDQTMSLWGQVDILINNAGILRDKSFTKMTLDDFKLVMDVHLMGSVHCCKAVWDIMLEQNYGRILMTTSGSGMYGNFGQTNYSAAKMAVIGLMNSLVLEGAKYNIRVNAIAPNANTRMTDDIIPPNLLALLKPEAVSAAALALCHENSPNRLILSAGAGAYSATRLHESEGLFLPPNSQTVEEVVMNLDKICDTSNQKEMNNVLEQMEKFIKKASAQLNS